MKKVTIYLVILTLLILSLWEFVYIEKYKNKIIELKAQVSILNTTVSDLKKSANLDNTSSSNLKHVLDIKLEECMKKDNYTTAAMIGCTDVLIDDWEKEIDNNINLLKQLLNSHQQQILLNSQDKWNDYKKVQWKLNKETLCAKTGTMYQTICIGNDMDIVKQRALELGSLYYFFNR